MTKNFKKMYSWKNVIFLWSKIAVYISLGFPKGCPNYKRSLQPYKDIRVRIRIHWPDWIPIQSGPGSGSGSETLHDLCKMAIYCIKHAFKIIFKTAYIRVESWGNMLGPVQIKI
jgi:hypothetical protein